MPRRKPPVIADSLLDQLLAGSDARTAFEADGPLDQLKKAPAERALNAEMGHHPADGEPGNSRNGYRRKTVTTGTGKIALEIPRDRAGSFDPAPITRRQGRFSGFDERIVSMKARGPWGPIGGWLAETSDNALLVARPLLKRPGPPRLFYRITTGARGRGRVETRAQFAVAARPGRDRRDPDRVRGAAGRRVRPARRAATP